MRPAPRIRARETLELFQVAARAERRLEIEPDVVVARLAPLAPERALAALRAQPALAAPAKLALAPGGAAELWAEVPRQRDLALARRLASEALDEAANWLDQTAPLTGGAREPALAAPGSARLPEVEVALAALAWPRERAADGAFHLYARSGIDAARVRVAEREGGCVVLSTETALRLAAPRALEALAHFALEVNRRLRLARVSVAADGGAARLVWDAVLPAELPADGALGLLAQALVGARAATLRAFAALNDPRVAESYLRARASRARRASAGANPRSRPRSGSKAKEREV
jgi:hypothetical protein